MTIATILYWAVAGIAATAIMDLAARFFGKLGLVRGAKGRWMGRWYLGLIRGRFTHSNISQSPRLAGEVRAAWIGHYAIGIGLAVCYFALAGVMGIPAACPIAAVGFGLATCVFPWFLVFPALGFGVLGNKGPKDLWLLRTSLLNHLAYGLGLWGAALVVQLA